VGVRLFLFPSPSVKLPYAEPKAQGGCCDLQEQIKQTKRGHWYITSFAGSFSVTNTHQLSFYDYTKKCWIGLVMCRRDQSPIERYEEANSP
jgi:hypothetical protein